MILVNNVEIKFESFPNGETRMIHDNINELVGEEEFNKIEFKYENDGDLIKLMFLKKYLDRYFMGENHLLIYYMPYSRMDRSEDYSPFTLKYVAEFINDLKFTSVSVIEPHSDVTIALLDNSTANYDNFEYIEVVKEIVGFNEDNDYIVFPDAGASKRYSKMKSKNILIGHKHRDFQTGHIMSLELVGDMSAGGKTAIIVDDLSSYGGTFVKTSEALREKGFEKVYLLVAHSENSIFKGKLFDHVDKVFTTNSILTEQNDWANKKFSNQLHIFEIEGEVI